MAPWIVALLFVLATVYTLTLLVFVLPKLRNRNIPGPPPFWFLGNAPQMYKAKGAFHLLLNRFREQYGDVYQLWFLFRQIVVISHPEDIKFVVATKNFPKAEEFNICLSPLAGRGLLTVDKAHHQKQRRAISKQFNEDFLRHLHDHIRTELKIFIGKLHKACKEHKPVDFDKEATSYTLDVICRTGFGRSADTQLNDSHPVPKAISVALKETYTNIASYPIRNVFGFYASPALRHATRVIEDFCNTVIDSRKSESPEESEKRPKDLLDIFLDMKDLPQWNIISEIATFLIAGHDTTSHTMSWLIYEVSQHPEIEEKIRSEVDSIWGNRDDFMLDFEEISKLEYLGLVWRETLRKYPVAATGTFRRLDTSIVLPSCGIPLKKGTAILIPPYVLHHHPKFWPEPEKFIPERFTRENMMKRHPFAFQTFSSGPRNCIGQFFATHEALTTLASLYHFFSFRLACNQKMYSTIMPLQ
eukprot:jgi/Galph1/5927/GphlegSOOS_G4570.1